MRATLLLAAVLLAGCAAPADVPLAVPGAGALCAEPCEALLDGSDEGAFEPDAAADPNDPRRLVAAQSAVDAERRRWIVTYASSDGGETWTSAPLFGGRDLPADHPLAGCPETYDPVLAFASDGAVLLAGIAGDFDRAVPAPLLGELPATAVVLFVARSTDGGVTFPETAIVSTGRGGQPACAANAGPPPAPTGPFDFVDKPAIAAGPDGTALLAWKGRAADPSFEPFQGTLVVALSKDGGRTWTELPTSPGEGVRFPFGAGLAIGPSGTLYAAFIDARFRSADEEDDLWFARSADEGRTWDADVVGKTVLSYPSVRARVLEDGRERVVVSYGTITNQDHQTPALLVSDDGGATWRPQVLVDRPVAGTVVMPTVALDAAGRAVVAYYHALGEEATEYRVAVVAGGEVLARETLSRAPIGRQTMSFYSGLGHYMGIAELPDGAYPVWVSGQNPATDLRGARVRTA